MPNDTVQPGSVDLRYYWYRLVVRLPLILVVVAVGVVSSGIWFYLTSQVYTATATLSVFPLTTERYAANRNVGNLVDMNAEAVLASSYQVSQAASEASSAGWSAADLREQTAITVGKDMSTMTISVSANDETRARSGAQAVAETYLATRSQQAEVSIEMLIGRDRARVDELRENLADALRRLDNAEASTAEEASATADVQILNQQVATLLSRISDLEGIDTTGGHILNPASETKVSVEPRVGLLVATGAAVGGIGGVLAAFLMPSGGRRLRRSKDVQRELEIPLVFEIGAREEFTTSVAAMTQRLLRVLEVSESTALAVVSHDSQNAAESFAADVVEELANAGIPALIASPTLTEGQTPSAITLLPVSVNSSEAAVLHAMRVADSAILVLERGVTTVKQGSRTLRLTKEMGCPVSAAVLKDGEEGTDAEGTQTPPPPKGGSGTSRRIHAAGSRETAGFK